VTLQVLPLVLASAWVEDSPSSLKFTTTELMGYWPGVTVAEMVTL